MTARNRDIKILLFSRKTIYDTELREKKDTRLKRLVSRNHRSVRRIKRADCEHKRTLEYIKRLLGRMGFSYRLVYAFTSVNAERYDLIMTVGGDGTVLFASHHAGRVPLLGVNSSPSNSAGHLTSATMKNLDKKLRLLQGGRIRRYPLHRLALFMDGARVHDRVLNDVLFTSTCPAVTTRYFLRVGGMEEEQMSSGIWIGPAAGSTAAMLSAGGKVLSPRSKKFQFVVREPRGMNGRPCRLKKGIVNHDEKIRIMSTWQKAEIFIDGPHRRILVQPGQTIEVRSSRSPLVLLGWKE